MCTLFARGNPITVVCSLVGIAPTTYHSWMEKAVEDMENGVEDSLFSEFSNRVQEAQAKAQAKALKIVWDAAVGGQKYTKTTVKREYLVHGEPDPDWSPALDDPPPELEGGRKLMREEVTEVTEVAKPSPSEARWFLERVNRKAWGRSVGITGGDGEGPVQVKNEGGLDVGALDDSTLEALAAILAGKEEAS